MNRTPDRLRVSGPELDALLELRVLPGLGEVRLRQLLVRYGSARAALAAPADELGPDAARERGSRRVRGRVERARSVIAEPNVHVLALHLPGYPERLHHLPDPPCVIFARGRLELLERPVVTIVGARRSTPYGRFAARTLAGDLAAAGIVVASGLARGIDAAAHEGALPQTVAVLGCGLDVPYPWENRALHERIAAEGLLLSEFAPGEPAIGHHFPRRNRVLAALALGIVVVEAGEKSGSIITVGHGLDLGRDVFCVPPNIGHLHSPGVQALVDDGATVVTTAGEILESIGIDALSAVQRGEYATAAVVRDVASSTGAGRGEAAAQAVDPSGADRLDPARADRRDRTGADEVDPAWPNQLDPDGLAAAAGLLRHLYTEPRHVDELAEDAGMPAGAVLTGLLELEMRGLVRQLPGMLFVAVPKRQRSAREPGPAPGLS